MACQGKGIADYFDDFSQMFIFKGWKKNWRGDREKKKSGGYLRHFNNFVNYMLNSIRTRSKKLLDIFVFYATAF